MTFYIDARMLFIGYLVKNINIGEEYIKNIGKADKSNELILKKHIPTIYNKNKTYKRQNNIFYAGFGDLCYLCSC